MIKILNYFGLYTTAQLYFVQCKLEKLKKDLKKAQRNDCRDPKTGRFKKAE